MAFVVSLVTVKAQTYKLINDICFTSKTDAYSTERLKLDICYPEDAEEAPVIIWFHGGGLTDGAKGIPDNLKSTGAVIVAPNYRLLPNVTVSETLDDAAEAMAWVFHHIAEYGGDNRKIVVTGYSAGGYLTLMLCLDKALLLKYSVNPDATMLYVSFSGQAITHYSDRKMQGLSALQPTINEMAPLYWVRKIYPPLVLITGDRELELYGRCEENLYLARMMKLVGNDKISLYEIKGYGHGDMLNPAYPILKKHLKMMLNKNYIPESETITQYDGDVNKDGRVDVADIATLISIMAGEEM